MAASKLAFTIYKCSSASGPYKPENILVDCPSDQMSRWSSETNNPPQFIILKLSQPAVVTGILFGKYELNHVCNLKKFRVFGGLNDDGFIELLDGGLCNNNQPELFDLRYCINGQEFACNVIKIEPLQSWGSSFNFSVWYIELFGQLNVQLVNSGLSWFNECKEEQVIRMCLKHLRDRNYLDIFESLQKRTKVQLEHDTVSHLHQKLVLEGDYVTVEHQMLSAAKDGLFDEYLNRQSYVPMWTNINTGLDHSPCPLQPGMRGGHQMVIDSASNSIFVYGGWNGDCELSDLWRFDILDDQWTCLCTDSYLEGGPSARSCHKMVFDCTSQHIFCLGRYADLVTRIGDSIEADFYSYDVVNNKWLQICQNTELVGGPSTIYDHQMVIDEEARSIFVFGGRILSSSGQQQGPTFGKYSGLFQYHIPTDSWKMLREDPTELLPYHKGLIPRMGQSVVFYPPTRTIYVIGGQRGKESFSTEMIAYHIEDDYDQIVFGQSAKSSSNKMPNVGATHRATIDVENGEIYVFSGLNKDGDRGARNSVDNSATNCVFVYKIITNKWQCIYKNDPTERNWNKTPSNKNELFSMKRANEKLMKEMHPMPRYAHQMVYDDKIKMHYLFGGNPGHQASSSKIRLDDFWSLKLLRPSETQIARECQWLIRKAHFEEMSADASRDPLEVLQYLRQDVREVVRHDVDAEREEFETLAFALFQNGSNSKCDKEEMFSKRTKLFKCLTKYFPDEMCPPKSNLIDIVPIQAADV